MQQTIDPLLLPQMSVTEKRYPIVLQALKEYEQHVDTVGDDALDGYRALQTRLEMLTEKDLSTYKLWEWWEAEGIEVLAFRVALPDPPRLARRLQDNELAEIIRRLLADVQEEADDEFAQQFSVYLDDWHHRLLQLNAPCYRYAWFLRQKNAQGQWFEHREEALVERLSDGCSAP